MKKFLVFILVLVLLIPSVASCNSDTPDDTDTTTTAPATQAPEADLPSLREVDEELFVGYGRECITPYNEDGSLMDITLAGYAETRPAKSVKDDIYASCTAVKDKAGALVLIYTLDLHSMQPNTAKSLQKAIAKELGVTEEQIILGVTHTHAAPHIEQFVGFVESKAIAAAKAAVADLTLVSELYAGTIEAENMNFIRRYSYDASEKPIAHLWDNDPTMPVVKFVREGKKDVIICNWAAHCDTVKAGNPTTISADYVSYFRSKLESEVDAYVSLHMAAAGDVSHIGSLEGERTFSGTKKYGEALAERLVDGLGTLDRLEIKSEIKTATEKVKVAFDHSEDETKGESASEIINYYWDVAGGKLTNEVGAMITEKGFKNIYEVEAVRARYFAEAYDRVTVGAVSIGNIVFAIAPYEMFTVNGVNIKNSADEFDLALICAYSNGMLGYIASEEAFEHDIYEVYSRRYVKDTATVLQEAISALIDELGK